MTEQLKRNGFNLNRCAFTSPQRGEVDLPTGRREAPPDDKLRKSGEGVLHQR